MRDDLLCHIFDDVHIDLCQIQPGHTGLSGHTAGDDHNIGAGGILIITGTDNSRHLEGGTLIDVQRLTPCFLFIDVDKNDLGSDALHHQIVGYGGAHITGADHTDFTHNKKLLSKRVLCFYK